MAEPLSEAMHDVCLDRLDRDDAVEPLLERDRTDVRVVPVLLGHRVGPQTEPLRLGRHHPRIGGDRVEVEDVCRSRDRPRLVQRERRLEQVRVLIARSGRTARRLLVVVGFGRRGIRGHDGCQRAHAGLRRRALPRPAGGESGGRIRDPHAPSESTLTVPSVTTASHILAKAGIPWSRVPSSHAGAGRCIGSPGQHVRGRVPGPA